MTWWLTSPPASGPGPGSPGTPHPLLHPSRQACERCLTLIEESSCYGFFLKMSAAATASSSCWLSRSFWVELWSTAYRPLCRPPWRRWRPRGRRTRCGPAGGRATCWSIRWRGCVESIMPVQGENRNNKLINKLNIFCFIHCIPLIWQGSGWAGAPQYLCMPNTVFACISSRLSPDSKWKRKTKVATPNST